MIAYILEIEFEKGIKRFYHDIISIDFLDKAIRFKDRYNVITYVDIRNKKVILNAFDMNRGDNE